MTPRKYAELGKAYRHALQALAFPVAQLTSIYCNAHLPQGAVATSPATFIPGMEAPKSVEQAGEIRAMQWRSYRELMEQSANQRSGG